MTARLRGDAQGRLRRVGRRPAQPRLGNDPGHRHPARGDGRARRSSSGRSSETGAAARPSRSARSTALRSRVPRSARVRSRVGRRFRTRRPVTRTGPMSPRRSPATARTHSSGFASGQTDGADPFFAGSAAPLADGASLVVIFAKATYPKTRIVISNGYAMTGGETLTNTISWGFAASTPVGPGAHDVHRRQRRGELDRAAQHVQRPRGRRRRLGRHRRAAIRRTCSATCGTPTRPTSARWVRPGDTAATVTVDRRTGLPHVGRAGALDRRATARPTPTATSCSTGGKPTATTSTATAPIDVDAPSIGASVVRKDIFVEMDYMGAESVCPCHLPLAPDLERIVARCSRRRPFADNPDGATGIALAPRRRTRARRGVQPRRRQPSCRTTDDPRSGLRRVRRDQGQELQPAAGRRIYYYMIWAHAYDGETSSSGNVVRHPERQLRRDARMLVRSRFVRRQGRHVHPRARSRPRSAATAATTTSELQAELPERDELLLPGVGRPAVPAANPAYFGYSQLRAPAALKEWALNENVGLQSPLADDLPHAVVVPRPTASRQSPGTANGTARLELRRRCLGRRQREPQP